MYKKDTYKDYMKNMDHACVLSIEPSSVILSETRYQRR